MTLREQAERLNISVHTLKNWQNRSESEELGVENLVSRANKLSSPKQILPRELLRIPGNAPLLREITEHLESLDLSLEGKLLYFIIGFLHFKGILKYSGTQEPDAPENSLPLNKILQKSAGPPLLTEELQMRLSRLGGEEGDIPLPPLHSSFLKKNLHKEYDLPGLIYQSLRAEGGRSREGAWFTPSSVIDSMLKPYIKKRESLFDPCCGSGLFLCRFAELRGSAEGVTGMDLDPMAVFITRINLFIRFPSLKSFRIITEADSLNIESWNLRENCLVATNPPWGAHLPASVKKRLRQRYPEISSGETASLFIRRCVEELPSGGAASFLLPESLCYVKTHKDIRTYLLKEAPPVKITPRGKLFHSVYSAVFSCDILKNGTQRQIRVNRDTPHKLKRYKENPDSIFNVHCSEKEAALIEKIRKHKGVSLPSQSLWLLGVVTGDNRRFIAGSPEKSSLPLLTGKEIKPFQIDEPRCWLRTERGQLQQSRKLEDYARAKLIYRFIGYTPYFAIDREGLVTLNSANSLVLPPPTESVGTSGSVELEELVFWYNSSLFRFLWFKQFRSVKMLRRHLENIPLPLWDFHEKSRIKALVIKAEKGQDVSSFMDDMIFDHYKLSEEERHFVLRNP